MAVDRNLAQLRNISQPKWSGTPEVLRQLASYTRDLVKGLDQKSACTVEQSLLLCFIALAIWALAPFYCLVRVGTCSSILVPTRGPMATATLSVSRDHNQKHHRVRDLADRLKFSGESIRQLVKDEPGVVKIKRGRKAAHTSYSIPESVAIRMYARLGGQASTFDEAHYRIADVVTLWGFGRETVRQLIKDDPGVLKFALGPKGAHSTYSVPDSVLKRVHNRLLYPV